MREAKYARRAAQNPAQSVSISTGKSKEVAKPANKECSDLPSDTEKTRRLLNG